MAGSGGDELTETVSRCKPRIAALRIHEHEPRSRRHVEACHHAVGAYIIVGQDFLSQRALHRGRVSPHITGSRKSLGHPLASVGHLHDTDLSTRHYSQDALRGSLSRLA